MLDIKINATAKGSDKSLISYFSDNKFENAEEMYLQTLDVFNETIASINTRSIHESGDSSRSRSPIEVYRKIKLPRIDLPKFSGNYLEWQNLKDLFQSIISFDPSLADVQKMHYLKSFLEGEAAQLLKHLGTSSFNYTSKWEMLETRYANKRVIIDSYLNSIISIPTISNETVTDLQFFYDDLLVFIVSKKLGRSSLIEWEKYLSDKIEYPTFAKLDKFLNIRIRTLEALQNAKEIQKFQSHKSKENVTKIKSHNTQIRSAASMSNSCVVCSEKHQLYSCEKFKSLSDFEKRQIVKNKLLCFNCLKRTILFEIVEIKVFLLNVKNPTILYYILHGHCSVLKLSFLIQLMSKNQNLQIMKNKILVQ